MEYTTKEKLYLVSILVMYTLLGAIGIYSTTLIFLFPILAIPLTFYLLRYKTNVKKGILIHLIIVVALLFTKGSIYEAILYLIIVAIPSHMIAYLYSKDTPIPHIIMYVGTGIIGLFYIYVIGMQYVGVDYIQYYMLALDEYKILQVQMIEELTQAIPQSQIETQLVAFKELINAQVLILKTIYPALFLMMGVFLATANIVALTAIGRLRKWKMQPLRQIGQFTFSKKMGVLFIVAMILAQVTIGDSEQLMMLGINLFFFISSLLEVLGMIVLFVLIKRRRWNIGLKLVATLVGIMLIVTFPTVFMVIGLGDTLFNFRKVKIIV